MLESRTFELLCLHYSTTPQWRLLKHDASTIQWMQKSMFACTKVGHASTGIALRVCSDITIRSTMCLPPLLMEISLLSNVTLGGYIIGARSSLSYAR